jgi:hypothetical protein
MQTTIITEMKIENQTKTNVIKTHLHPKSAKSLVGSWYWDDPTVISGSVVDPFGKKVLELEKDPVTLKQIKTYSVHLEWEDYPDMA